MGQNGVSIRQFARMVGVSGTAVKKAIDKGVIVKGIVKNGSEQYILPDVAAKEYGKKIVSDGFTDPRKDPIQDRSVIDEKAMHTGMTTGMSPERRAKLKHLVYKAQIAELQAKQLDGELVRKEDVYRDLFAKGVALKEELLAVPDRVTDDMRAAETRAEAYRILREAIEKILLSHTTTAK